MRTSSVKQHPSIASAPDVAEIVLALVVFYYALV
jgi:hypothetical protein